MLPGTPDGEEVGYRIVVVTLTNLSSKRSTETALAIVDLFTASGY